MKLFVPVLLVVLATCYAAEDASVKQWALLVAGSNTWDNYRHQADIAHAYQILLKRGIPANNIVVMMYDDIAHNYQNPTPGVVINKPNGPNVWKGVKIDYKGENVHPDVFLAVLSGNKKAVKGKGTGRVIESGPNDHVFVNFADHGGTGVLLFVDDLLHVTDLISTLKKMSANKKYGKLVFYVEACESGSMFNKVLPSNTKIWASTAANAIESSWACYCSYKSYPCLGDVYSIKWMEHEDKVPSPHETLLQQYKVIKKQVTTSHVSLFGDKRLNKDKASDYLGNKKHQDVDNGDDSNDSELDPVDSRDATLYYYKRMAKYGNKQEKVKYAEKVKNTENNRKIVDQIFDNIVDEFVKEDDDLKNEIVYGRKEFSENGMECQKKLYTHFNNKCFKITKNPYVARHLYKLANACEIPEIEPVDVLNAIEKKCNENFADFGNVI